MKTNLQSNKYTVGKYFVVQPRWTNKQDELQQLEPEDEYTLASQIKVLIYNHFTKPTDIIDNIFT